MDNIIENEGDKSQTWSETKVDTLWLDLHGRAGLDVERLERLVAADRLLVARTVDELGRTEASQVLGIVAAARLFLFFLAAVVRNNAKR